jgi:peptide/nickel transport system ATP-binding protein
MNIEPILDVSDLSVGYLSAEGLTLALDNINLKVPKKEIFAIVGESGCGKSTLASAMVGFVQYPARNISGKIVYNAQDVLKMEPYALRKILLTKLAIVPQAAMNSLNPVIKIRKEIDDIIKSHESDIENFDKESIKSLLNYVELPDLVLDMYPHQLSGGMKQRLLIALAMLFNPNVLIMDEPTTGLDVVVQKSILDLVKKINAEKETTIIFVTHDLSVAKYVSSFIAIMYAGKVVESGPTGEIAANPIHPYTAALIASTPNLSKRGMRLPTIGGFPPKFSSNQTLCTFRERCSKRLGVCDTDPVAETDSGSRKVLCHLIKYGKEKQPYVRETTEPTERESKVENTGFSMSRDETISDEIILKNISKTFHTRTGMRTKAEVKALSGVNLKVKTGEIRALVGASGSGKSTIANIIMSEVLPDEGVLTIAGRDFSKPNEKGKRQARKQVQLVFQDPYSSLSPIHNVLYQIIRPIIINHEVDKEEAIRRANALLEAVKLVPVGNFAYKNPSELSGGQRQRVAIAKAIAVGARFLVADEPVSMLDASVRAEILNLLKDLKARFNLGILYITHDLSTVSYLSDYIYVLKSGIIVDEGKPEDILESSNNAYTRELIQAVI